MPFYRFDGRHFETLEGRSRAGSRLAMVRLHGETGAAGLFFREAGLVQYHLSGTDARYRGHQPTKLMVHAVARWAKERGDRWFHLGGGVGSGDDARCSTSRRASHPCAIGSSRFGSSWTRTEYQRRVGLEGSGARPEAASDYFPAYRRR
ncbi:MAG: GNAT family N-acetyltransferase [Chloroflexota bacterium]